MRQRHPILALGTVAIANMRQSDRMGEINQAFNQYSIGGSNEFWFWYAAWVKAANAL
jgi:hypothetical protein